MLMYYLAILFVGMTGIWSYPLDQFQLYSDDLLDDPEALNDPEMLYDTGKELLKFFIYVILFSLKRNLFMCAFTGHVFSVF